MWVDFNRTPFRVINQKPRFLCKHENCQWRLPFQRISIPSLILWGQSRFKPGNVNFRILFGPETERIATLPTDMLSMEVWEGCVLGFAGYFFFVSFQTQQIPIFVLQCGIKFFFPLKVVNFTIESKMIESISLLFISLCLLYISSGSKEIYWIRF